MSCPETIWLDESGSTNTYLLGLSKVCSTHGLTVAARHQPRGRGRFNRHWYSGPGESLTFSILLNPQIQLAESGLVMLGTATAVATCIEKIIDTAVTVRWPNDVLVSGDKIAGILSEVSPESGHQSLSLVVGVGINVNQSTFGLSGFRTNPTSLRKLTGASLNPEFLLERCRSAILEEIGRLSAGDRSGCRARFLSRCKDIGKMVSFMHSPYAQPRDSTIVGIAPDGGLELLTDGEVRVAYAGEITSNR